MFPKPILDGINNYFAHEEILDFQIKKHELVFGGDINQTQKIITNKGDFFIKWNHSKKYPSMFEKEFFGLQTLASCNEIKIAKVLYHAEIEEYGFLMMLFEESGKPKPNFWEQFGRQLAELHKHSNEKFGLDYTNYIGSLSQNNEWKDNWPEFFVINRLEPQLKNARESQNVNAELIRKFEKLFSKIENLIPTERPSMLHGDLWKGNYLVDYEGDVVLIDPAIYYGHREMDLGMTKLFGGFPDQFYSSYHQTYPLESEWQNRLDISNLYPLLVHLNLFGSIYLPQIENIIKKYI